VTVSGAFAQARRRLEPGIELSGEDFAFLRGPLPGAPDLFPSTADAIEGRVLRRALEAGEALRTTMLVTPHTLRRGDLVELQVRSRSVLLHAPGRAEQSGSTGDEIRCRNLETGQPLRAKIVDANHVEVILP
jgi:flagella basal body P-ring formation protein FlgA